jgi:arylsulfatase A-like enzyme
MSKPNFIIFYCDDLGYGDLGCYGSEHMKTPHLDRLAAQGVRFTDWYSNCPVCSPSRASLLTGMYPQKTGVVQILGGKRGTKGLLPNVVTLAEALKPLGYATGIFGKWHLGSEPDTLPNRRGFDEFFGFHAGCVDYYSHIFYWGQGGGVNPVHDLWHNEREVWHNGAYLTELITERAIDFIERHANEPFFVYVPYNAPHYPMHAPQKYMDRFAHLPWDRQVMAAMIAAVDDGVGAITATLRNLGLMENTVIFFSSDNGPSTESRNWLDGTEDKYYGGSAGIFRGHKFSLFEGGIREPAILTCPGRIPEGQVLSEIGIMMDIWPTFVELAGDESRDYGVDGRSVWAMVTEGAPSPHKHVCWQLGNQMAIRQGRWKLVLNGRIDSDKQNVADPVHLSDLSADPGERTNLADQFPEVVAELRSELERWRAELNV